MITIGAVGAGSGVNMAFGANKVNPKGQFLTAIDDFEIYRDGNGVCRKYYKSGYVEEPFTREDSVGKVCAGMRLIAPNGDYFEYSENSNKDMIFQANGKKGSFKFPNGDKMDNGVIVVKSIGGVCDAALSFVNSVRKNVFLSLRGIEQQAKKCVK